MHHSFACGTIVSCLVKWHIFIWGATQNNRFQMKRFQQNGAKTTWRVPERKGNE